MSTYFFNAKNSVECYLEKLSYNEDLLENIITEENINLVKKVFNQMSDTHRKVLKKFQILKSIIYVYL